MTISVRSLLVGLAAGAMLSVPAFAQTQSAAVASANGTPAAPAAAAAPDVDSTAASAARGPTLTGTRVAVQRLNQTASETDKPVIMPAPRHGGYGEPVALMAVGAAGLITGAIIGGNAGTIIMVGGAVVGLIGLYEFVK